MWFMNFSKLTDRISDLLKEVRTALVWNVAPGVFTGYCIVTVPSTGLR